MTENQKISQLKKLNIYTEQKLANLSFPSRETKSKPFDFFKLKRRNTILGLGGLVIAAVMAMIVTDFDLLSAMSSIVRAIVWTTSNFYPTVQSLEKLPNILNKMLDTILLAIASTTVAAGFSLAAAIFGAEKTQINKLLSRIIRSVSSVCRNVPIVAWAIILLFSFGQSALTGFFALFIYTFGFLTRAFIETFDESSDNSVEALRASGAKYLHVIVHSVFPSSLPLMISWVLYMIETNIRDATLVGILTGTGIGFVFELYYKGFYYHNASLVVLVIVLSVVLIETISNSIRRGIM